MSYTTSELTAAIEKLVRTSIRRQQGALGNRDLSLTFTDYMDAAAGVFILFQNAPFYTLYLGVQRLRESLQTQQEAITDFITIVEATGRYTTPVTSLSPLANASVALAELESVAGQRSSSFADIEESSAFQRFEANTQRFLDESGKNVKSGGVLVKTPEEARGLLASSISSLQEGVEDIIRRVGLYEGAIADYSSLNLPVTLASSIIANARASLDGQYEALNDLTPKQRLGILRDSVLDVLAARSTVRGFGNLTPPTTFLPIDGSGSVYADDSHPAVAAVISSEIYGPYPILSNNQLYFTAEGQALTVAVQPSFVPYLESTVYGPYDIYTAAETGDQNDELLIRLNNWPAVGSSQDIDVTFSSGGDPTSTEAWDIAAHINDRIEAINPSIPLVAEPYANPLRFTDLVAMTGSGPFVFTSVNPAQDFGVLGVTEGDHIIITDPTASNYRAVYTVDVGGVAAGALTCSNVYHPGVYSAESADIEVTGGSDELPVRLRTSETKDAAFPGSGRPDYRLTSLNDRMSIELPSDGITSDDIQFLSVATIGFYIGSEAIARKTTASEVVESLNLSASSSWNGVRRVSADTVFNASVYSGRGRTDPYDWLKVVCSKLNQEVVTATLVGGFAYAFAVDGAATAGVVGTDRLVIRASSAAADVGMQGIISTVSDTEVVATFGGPLAGGLTDLDIEIGPDLTGPAFDSTDFGAQAIITNSPANDGTYNVLARGSAPFELTIDAPMPQSQEGGAVPNYYDVQVGYSKVRFSSTDQTTATSLDMDDDGGNSQSTYATFFTSVSRYEVGSTPYFQLSSWPKALEEGDLLELYPNQFDTPLYTVAVASLEQSALLLELWVGLPTDTPTYTFTLDTPVPFARIRKQGLNSYVVMQDQLEAWLLTDGAQTSYFVELQRLLNPLAVNLNPTATEVGDARAQLWALQASLGVLDGYLAAYEARQVSQVDALVSTLIEKGGDRAVDILLEGQFGAFFTMDQDELSYAGTVQKGIKEIMREDIPQRKDNRLGQFAAEDVTIGEYDEPDFEYDFSDIDDVGEPDIPAGSTY